MAPPSTAPQQFSLTKLPAWGKVLTGGIVVGLTLGAYWLIFYSDDAAKIEGAKRQRKTLLDDLAKQQEAQQSYFADTDELGKHEKRAKELNKVLPPDAEEDEFLSTVQAASNAAGIDLKGYAPQPEAPQTFYAKVPMKLDLTGKFHQVAKFAYELGKADRIINVENIELSEPKLVGDDIILKARCLATAFHAIAPKETPRGPGAAKAPGAPAPAPGATK